MDLKTPSVVVCPCAARKHSDLLKTCDEGASAMEIVHSLLGLVNYYSEEYGLGVVY
jgi:hypothetical protein